MNASHKVNLTMLIIVKPSLCAIRHDIQHSSTKFRENPSGSYSVILLTNKQIHWTENIVSLTQATFVFVGCTLRNSWTFLETELVTFLPSAKYVN